MLVVVNPFGPVHTVLKVIGTSTAWFNSTCTVHIRVTADPIGRTGLGVLLERITKEGAGTV